MILPVKNYTADNTGFTAKKIDEEELKNHPILLENNFSNRMTIGWDKFTNALTVDLARGLKGSKNSNFYEFLTMGSVIPTITGSLMFMAVFNSANRFFLPPEGMKASKFGSKMALGVVFYAIMKNLSKDFVTRPVKWFTGVDTEEPYVEMKFKLPENKKDTLADITSIEYHKVLESLEFPRWEVKYGNQEKGEPVNGWFDKIAKKIGLGSDLKDSDQDVKPRVKEIAVKTNLAKTFSSYLWAAAGVGLALQEPWDKFFNVATWKVWKGRQFLKTAETFFTSLRDSAIQMFLGPENEKNFFKKHGGKTLIGLAALSTLAGLTNVLISQNKPSKLDSADIIEPDRKYVVN